MFHKQIALFQDPGIHYPIDDVNLPFSEYINISKDIIARYRQDLDQNAELIIEANTPYELIPAHPQKLGALLIHGLFDTPFIMKDIGLHLQKQGLLTRSIILPGHGTIPGSLLNVDYQDWLKTLRYGIHSFPNDIEKIFLVGFSTGALLSVYQTLQDPSRIAGLILLSPAFKINTLMDFATNWNKAFNWATARANWLYITDENDYAKYRSVCFNSAYQVYRLTKMIKKMDHKKQPACPIFMSLSYEDRIVSSKKAIEYFIYYSNPKNKMILYKNKVSHFHDSRIIVRNSHYPEWNIKSFSHISIPISPNNPHYGIHGDYPFASRIEEQDAIIYTALDKPQKFLYDHLHKLKLSKYKRQRLTFNPDFDFLMGQINDFLVETLS